MKYEIEVKDKNAKYVDSKCVVSLIVVDGKSTIVIPVESIKLMKMIWECPLCDLREVNMHDMLPACQQVAKLVHI